MASAYPERIADRLIQDHDILDRQSTAPLARAEVVQTIREAMDAHATEVRSKWLAFALSAVTIPLVGGSISLEKGLRDDLNFPLLFSLPVTALAAFAGYGLMLVAMSWLFSHRRF